jgi:hypothetical protein
MLGEIVRTAVEREPDLELIPASMSLDPGSRDPGAVDLLIMVVAGGEVVSECREWMTRFPNVRLLAALEDERGDGGLFELQALAPRLGSLSPVELAQTIRKAANA